MILGSAGITTGIVGNAIGSSSRDIGTLCTHNNINKWSKHKPIRYNKVEGLSDEEFKGTSGDNSLGIYYGIKASTIPVMSISFTWSELGILPILNQTYTVSGSITNGGNLVSNFNFDNI